MSRANPRFHRHNTLLPSLAGGIAMRIQPSGFIDNQIWLVSFDYISFTTGTPNTAGEANLAVAWATACIVAFKGCLASDVSLTQIKVSCLTVPTRQPAINNTVAGLGNGTISGTHFPSETAGLIFKNTAIKGQHGRGRNYLPGVPLSFVTSATDPNRLNTTGSNAYASLVSALVGAISDGTNSYSLGVTQRTQGGNPVTNGAVQLQTGVRLLLGTVRRRRIGRGK